MLSATQRAASAKPLPCAYAGTHGVITLYSLGAVMYDRYLVSGGGQALEETIQLYREALSLRPKGHRWRAQVVDDLAAALRLRFSQTYEHSLLLEAEKLESEGSDTHVWSENYYRTPHS